MQRLAVAAAEVSSLGKEWEMHEKLMQKGFDRPLKLLSVKAMKRVVSKVKTLLAWGIFMVILLHHVTSCFG